MEQILKRQESKPSTKIKLKAFVQLQIYTDVTVQYSKMNHEAMC